VRQNLFTLEDCQYKNGSGKLKAQATAESLRAIAADVQSEGIHLSIPMPGHSETKESIAKSVTTLDQLIQDCDVVYLLTDTRESRWLPNLMAAAHDKIMINAALGLDSWSVMRHGGGVVVDFSYDDHHQKEESATTTPTPRLGCYFCNDVIAPENSTKNRTLDQQCTVACPGLAPIAASMAVELMVSLLHHPARQRAAAPAVARSSSFSPIIATTTDDSSLSTTSPLGVMPHQIHGSLVSYTMMTPTVPAFRCSTGCSVSLMEVYQQGKLEVVYQACQSTDGTYLETLSGLTGRPHLSGSGSHSLPARGPVSPPSPNRNKDHSKYSRGRDFSRTQG
jgi:ubiquitin-like modifier-activating enzyme ATG7